MLSSGWFEAAEDLSKLYVVSLKSDGSYECSYPHWIHGLKKRGGLLPL